MAAVRVPDVLLRISPKMLERYQSLAVAGAGRGRAVPLPYTFTRAAVRRVRGHDGTGRKFAAGKVAISYPAGLVDANGNPVSAIRSDGARTQLVTDPENFGAWTIVGTPVLTAGVGDPFGGSAAYSIEDDSVTVQEGIVQSVGFTGDGEKSIALFFQEFDSAANPRLGIWDNTVGVWRHLGEITWVAGVPSVATAAGSGTRFTPEQWGSRWRIAISVAGVVAANTNQFFIYPAAATAAQTGTTRFFGANAWNAPFPSSYQGPGESAGAADSLTTAINFGTMALTVYGELSAVWPVTFTHATEQGIFGLGQSFVGATDEAFMLEWFGTTLNLYHGSNNAVVLSQGNPATLTHPIKYAAQLYSDGAVQLHLKGANGVSLSGTKSAARAFVNSTFKNSTLYSGTREGGTLPGHYDHLDHRIHRGVFSLAECEVVP